MSGAAYEAISRLTEQSKLNGGRLPRVRHEITMTRLMPFRMPFNLHSRDRIARMRSRRRKRARELLKTNYLFLMNLRPLVIAEDVWSSVTISVGSRRKLCFC